MEQCDNLPPNVSSMTPNFGGISTFYDIAKGISDGLQSTPNAKTYNDLNNLLFGNGPATTADVAKDLILNQIGAIIFWSIGFVFVLAAIVLLSATAIWQCCFSCVPKSESRSKPCGYILIFLLFSSFSIILTGTILFNIAENQLVDSINNGQNYVTRMNYDLDTVMTTGMNQIICQVNKSTDEIFENIDDQLQQYGQSLISNTKQQVGISDLNSFDAGGFQTQNDETIRTQTNFSIKLDALNENDASCKSTKQNFTDHFSAIEAILNVFSNAAINLQNSQSFQSMNQQINDIQNKIQENANDVVNNINSTQSSIGGSINDLQHMVLNMLSDVANTCNSLNVAQNDITTSSEYTLAQYLVRLFVTIPSCLGMLFCLFAIIALCSSIKSSNGARSWMATLVLISFYISILLAILLILISSAAFVGGWAMSAVCVPVFEDSDYRLFHLINISTPSINNGQQDNINVGEVFTKCQDPRETFFSAINGDTIISTNLIDQQINLTQYRDQCNSAIMSAPNVTFSYDMSTLSQLTILNQLLQEYQSLNLLESCGQLKDVEDANKARESYMTNLETSVQLANDFYNAINKTLTNIPNTKSISIQLNNEQFDEGGRNMNESLNELMTNLQTETFKCNSLVNIYSNGGDVICRQYGEPIHGIWAAIGLVGLFMFFLAILLLLTYRWLKTEDGNNSSTSYKMGSGLRRFDEQSQSEVDDPFDKPMIQSTRRLPRIDEQQYPRNVISDSSISRTPRGLPRS